MEGQLSIWDLQQDNLADKYEDGIPETIQEVVELVEQRTGLKFKEHNYKSIKGVYRCKYKKVTFELNLGRFVADVHEGSRYISTGIDGGLWGKGFPAYDIDETIDLIKAWKEQV